MNLQNKAASVLVTEDGREVLRVASISRDPNAMLRGEIVEAEDLGLWLRIFRGEVEHHFLLRWEYILGVDVQAPRDRPVGLSGGKV